MPSKCVCIHKWAMMKKLNFKMCVKGTNISLINSEEVYLKIGRILFHHMKLICCGGVKEIFCQ